MSRIDDQGGTVRAMARLGRAMLLAAAGWAASRGAVADELRLFDGPARPRYVTPFATGDDSELRLLDLEHSYPWGGGDPAFRLDADGVSSEDPQEPPPSSPPPEVKPPPKKLFDTTTTLWTVAALLGGVGQGIGAPIKYGTNSWH